MTTIVINSIVLGITIVIAQLAAGAALLALTLNRRFMRWLMKKAIKNSMEIVEELEEEEDD